MVYDCFSFFNELDLLEIRLNVLDPVVDRFVLVEASRTHSNKPKPMYFAENKDRFARFKDKIVYIGLDSFPDFQSSWTYENFQRNKILDGLSACDPDDIVIISDLDEIPEPGVISAYKSDGIKTLEQASFSCFINYKSVIMKKWHGSNILNFRDIQNNATEKYGYEYNAYLIESLNQGCTPTKIRIIRQFPVIKHAGWHFTYLGGIEKIKYKLDSFAHQEFNKDSYISDREIQKKLEKGYDLFNPKDNRCIPVRIGNNFPQYLVQNQDKYRYLIFPVTKMTEIRNVLIVLITYVYYYGFRKPIQVLRSLKKWFRK